MAKYDGEIRIKAELETNEFDEQSSKLIDKIEEQTLKLNKQKIKVKELEDQYKSFIDSASKTPEELGIEKSLKNAEKELKGLEELYKIGQNYLKNQNLQGISIPPEILDAVKKYEKLIETTKQLREQLKQVRLDPASTQSVKKLGAELELAKNKSKTLENNIGELKKKLGTLGTENLSTLIDTLKNKFTSMSTSASNSFINVKNGLASIGNRILRLAGSAFVFNVISAGFRQISTGIWQLIKSDNDLNQSLKTIRFNLMTAFAPIYQYILPALKALMQALAVVTSRVAAFVSMLFGTTLNQSQAIAGNMIQTIDITNKSSKALQKNSKNLNKVAKSAKKASEELAAFDKIQVLNLKNNEEINDNYNIPDEIPKIAIPPIENREIVAPIRFDLPQSEANRFQEIINRLKAPLRNINYEPLNESLKNLKITLSGYTKSAGDGLWWLYDEVLAPLGRWTMNQFVPLFIKLLTAVLDAFKPVWDKVGDDIKWLWKDFLKPAAQYSGEKLLQFLDDLTKKVNIFGEDLKTNNVALEWFSATIIGLATSLSIVGLIQLIMKLSKVVLAFNAALLANPWTWVVVGLTAIIAVVIQLARHWDELEQYFGAAWESFKNTIKSMGGIFWGFFQNISGTIDMFIGLFTGDWNRMWRGAANSVIAPINIIIGAFNVLMNAINTVRYFIAGGINFLIDKINSFGFDLPDWLGGGSFHMHIPKIPTQSLALPTLPQIPKLAQGAVLEGGNPMLAYINDQPRGNTNIETPLNTMVEAFKTAMNSNAGGRNVVIEATGDMAGLISFLNLKLKKENARIGNNMISGDVWI